MWGTWKIDKVLKGRTSLSLFHDGADNLLKLFILPFSHFHLPETIHFD